MRSHFRTHARFVLILFLVTGCGESRKTAKVAGEVTLDGKPASEIGILFEPQDLPGKKGPRDAVTSVGATDAAGHFELSLSDTDQPGALVGKHTVRFSDRLATSASDNDAGPSTAPRSRIADKYGNGVVEFEVPAGGTDQAKFELTSK